MDIVAVLTQKGGAGKTTLALALAVAAYKAGRSSLVIDVDPQATASSWSDRRGTTDPPPVLSAQASRLPHVLEAARAQGFDFVIIDTPPRAEQAALVAARAASLIVIPCRPAVFDLETIETTLALVRAAAREVQVTAVLNAVPARGQKQAQATTLLTSLGVTVCPSALGARTAFVDAAFHGRTAQEHDPHGKAAAETRAVYNYIARALSH